MGSRKRDALIPPDPKRCQAERREGSFMTLGPRGMVRCSNAPSVIVTETEPDEDDGRIGSMSLCADCLAVFLKSMPPGFATIATIRGKPKARAKRTRAQRTPSGNGERNG